MLEDILKQAQPGVNPQLEAMITKLMQGSGSTPGQAASGVAGMQSQGVSPGTMATGAVAPPSSPGGAQPMAPEEANLTYQALIKKGVPPQVAQQAIANPQMLRELLAQLYKGGGGVGPQEAVQGPGAAPSRVSAPPLGGGGGYG